jgi:hypothetical protein
MQQTGMNADIMNQFQQMMLAQNQNRNQFNQQNAGQDLNAQMANQSNQLQNQGLMNQYGLGMGNLYQGLAGQNLQAQLGALGPLMQQYSQMMGLQTPQAQTIQKNTGFGNFMNFATDLTGMGANLMGMGGMGGGGMGGFMNGLQGLFGGGGQQAPNMMNTSFGQYPSYSGGLMGGYQGMPFGNMGVANQPMINPMVPFGVNSFAGGLTPNLGVANQPYFRP